MGRCLRAGRRCGLSPGFVPAHSTRLCRSVTPGQRGRRPEGQGACWGREALLGLAGGSRGLVPRGSLVPSPQWRPRALSTPLCLACSSLPPRPLPPRLPPWGPQAPPPTAVSPGLRGWRKQRPGLAEWPCSTDTPCAVLGSGHCCPLGLRWPAAQPWGWSVRGALVARQDGAAACCGSRGTGLSGFGVREGGVASEPGEARVRASRGQRMDPRGHPRGRTPGASVNRGWKRGIRPSQTGENNGS